MKFEYLEGASIPDGKIVRVTQTKHIFEVMDLKTENNGLNKIKKLSKDQYIFLDTGEVIDYKKSENRGQNIAGLKTTFKHIRNLINNNFDGSPNELHVVLTYAENMMDCQRLHLDFKKFWLRFKYRYPNTDYISIVEPQARGAWHCHVLLKFHDQDQKKVFIANDEIAELWGLGFTKTRSLHGIDNIGAYLSAYLADVELTDEDLPNLIRSGAISINKNFDLKEVQGKKFIKGGRVHFYPPGMNIYRKSKGIKQPEIQKIPFHKIKEIVGSDSPDYSRTVKILDDSDKELQAITYYQYNTKRLKNESVENGK